MELPKNKKIRLIQGISGVFHTPYIVEGETSSTGKTIKVEEKHGRRTYRLDTEKILTGGVEVRRATTSLNKVNPNLGERTTPPETHLTYHNLILYLHITSWCFRSDCSG